MIGYQYVLIERAGPDLDDVVYHDPPEFSPVVAFKRLEELRKDRPHVRLYCDTMRTHDGRTFTLIASERIA